VTRHVSHRSIGAASGYLEAKIKPFGVVIKPNIGSLPPRKTFLIGDTVDLRVSRPYSSM